MIVPPPTPNSPLNAPAAVAIDRETHESGRHRRAYYGACPLPPQTRPPRAFGR